MGETVDRRLDVLTSMRFFASAMIVFFHFPTALDLKTHLPQFALGVSFFFVLSGFVLTWANSGGFSTWSFYKKRILRLWPVHLVTLFAVITLQIYPNPLYRHDFILPVISNVFMLQTWVPTHHYVSANGVAWSISAEIFFYALFPLIVVGQRWKLAAIVSAAVVAVVLLGIDSGRLQIGGKEFLPIHMVLEWPPMRIMEFAFGIGAGKLFIAHRQEFERATATSFELAAIAAIVIFGAAGRHFSEFLPGIPATTVWLSQCGGAVIFAAAIFVFGHQRGAISNILKWRTFVFLGEISFSTYMVHQIVLKYAWLHHSARQLGTVQTTVLCVTVIYIASYLTWRFVEKPFTERGRKTTRPLQKPQAMPLKTVRTYLDGHHQSVMGAGGGSIQS